METGRRKSQQSVVIGSAATHYESLRDDWRRDSALLARLIAKSVGGKGILVGFPRQWVPIFVHFGVLWRQSVAPTGLIPVASDLNETQLVRVCERAKKKGVLRTLVEAFAALDPLIADVLYRLDRRDELIGSTAQKLIPLTGWQSYG